MASESMVYQQGLFYDHNSDNQDLYSLLENYYGGYDFTLPNCEQQYHFPQLQQEHNGSLLQGYGDFPNNQAPETYQFSTDQWDLSPPLMMPSFTPNNEWGPPNSSSESPPMHPWVTTTSSSKAPKPPRARSKKGKGDIESKRMTHIEVERNRRKQMNEYLSVIKSMIPDSYAQRGDQASIVGGAINYVKELEHNLYYLSAKKMQTNYNSEPAFGEFFSFPQYREANKAADVEVTMVESHVNVNIRARKCPRQLMHIISGLQSLRVSILHLNVNTMDHCSLYSLSVKVEDESKLSSTDEIAAAVHELLGRIEP